MQRKQIKLRALSADTTRQLDVFGHDSDTARVKRTQIAVFKQRHQIRLRGFLQSEDRGTLFQKKVHAMRTRNTLLKENKPENGALV